MSDNLNLLAGCIVPHPPLLIPEIGGRDLVKVESTKRAMEEIADRIKFLEPEVLFLISPHSPILARSFGVKLSQDLEGSFANFGCPQVRIRKQNDVDLAMKIIDLGRDRGIEVEPIKGMRGRWLSEGEELDHGSLVPLYYIDQKIDIPVVSASISYLSYRDHFRFGEIIREACEELGRKMVFVASGDLSHRLLPGAPAGFNPRGKEFDQAIVDIVSSGSFESIYDIEEELVEDAGECGFRSIHTLWGSLSKYQLENYLLSYEGPFGVGYLVSYHQCLKESA